MGDFAEGADDIGVSFEGAYHLIALPESDGLVGGRYHVNAFPLPMSYQSGIRRPSVLGRPRRLDHDPSKCIHIPNFSIPGPCYD